MSRDRVEVHVSGKVVKALSPAEAGDSLGLVLGFTAVSWKRDRETKQLEPYCDEHDDIITDTAILKAAYKFAMAGAPMDAMHGEVKVGKVLFQMPMTREIAGAFGFKGDEYGWMVGVKPDSAEVYQKFATGAYKGFSLGGWVVRKAYAEGTCPECSAKVGAGACAHQPPEVEES